MGRRPAVGALEGFCAPGFRRVSPTADSRDMYRIPSIALVLAVVVLVGACTASPPELSGGQWTGLAAVAAEASVPEGWTIDAPFTMQTRHWPGHTLVGPGPQKIWAGSDMALVRSPVSRESQAYVFRGPADVWRSRLDAGLEHLDHPLLSIKERGTLETADGVELRFVSAQIEPGVIAGDALSYFLAYGRIESELFVVDAGGATGRFDAKEVRRFVETLTPRSQYATRPRGSSTAGPEGRTGDAPAIGRGSSLHEEEAPSIAVREQVMRFLPSS